MSLSVSELQDAIDRNGDVGAMFKLAVLMHMGGKRVEEDPARAMGLYERAVKEGAHVGAMFNLGLLLCKGAEGVEKDPARAMGLYERAVREGAHMGAMSNLAVLLCKEGEEIETDPVRAMGLYERAVGEGADVGAMSNLAVLLWKGAEGVEKDPARAVRLLERAVHEGTHVGAIFNLGVLLQNGAEGVEKDPARAVGLYDRAIQEGAHVGAMFNLGLLLCKGAEGVKKDPVRAMGLFERAVQEGAHIWAMSNLAVLLCKGAAGVEKDPARAIGLLERAVVEGSDVGAMFNLGLLLSNAAEGVEKDPVRAMGLLERAVQEGAHVGAMFNLGVLLQNGAEGVEKDLARAARLYERAVQEGTHVGAMFNLAVLVEDGAKGVKKDPARAVRLYERAVHEGADTGAMGNLASLLRRGGDAVPRDIPRAIHLLELAVASGEDPSYSVELARILLSGDVGAARDTVRALGLLEAVVRQQPHASAMHELGVLLLRGDDGVTQDVARGQDLLKRCSGEASSRFSNWLYNRRSVEVFTAGVDVTVRVEKSLHGAMVKPRQCFVVVLGGGGRGKTSTVRSLRRMSFLEEHIATELASLERLWVVPGGGHLSESGVEELTFNSESLMANMSRAKFVQKSLGETDKYNSYSHSTSSIFGKGNPAKVSIEERGDEARVSPEPCLSERDRANVIERSRQALREEEFPTGGGGALLQCWDLGGQSQYMMAHSLFVRSARILVFVIDLERLWDEGTRNEEIEELCRWMQLAHALSEDVAGTWPIIVGTRKATCGDVWGTWEIVRRGLTDRLGEGAYDAWVKSKSDVGEMNSTEREVEFVAIENRTAQSDAKGSGVEELEMLVKSTAESVVEAREAIPARWVALTEELEKLDVVYLTKSDVKRLVSGFPAFDKDESAGEVDALEAFRYYRGLGRVVLFEVSESEYYVFMDPSRIMEFVRQVTGPEGLARRRLGQRHEKMLKEGLLTREGLGRLWRDHSATVQDVLLNMLCEFDLLVRLQSREGDGDAGSKEELIGVPALLESGWEGFRWGMKAGQSEVQVRTKFEDVLPVGLMGCVVAYLHRTVGGGQTEARMLRSDAVMLSLGGVDQVVVVFVQERREIVWTIRSMEALGAMHMCLKGLEEFLDGPLRRMKIRRRHVIVTDCREEQDGCGGRACVEFEIPLEWVRGRYELLQVQAVQCHDAECRAPWNLFELLPNLSMEVPWSVVAFLKNMWKGGRPDAIKVPFVLRHATTEYDVFISHAGADKHTVARILCNALRARGLRVFFDLRDVRPSSRRIDEQLFAAIRGSKAAVFILSVDFAARKWPILELLEFLRLKETAVRDGRQAPIMFPLFYKLSVEDCKHGDIANQAEYRGVFERQGFYEEGRQRVCSTAEVMEALKRLGGFLGLEIGKEESVQVFVDRAADRFLEGFRKEFPCGT